MLTFAVICSVLGVFPGMLLLYNLAIYRRAPAPLRVPPFVSVLIPARNEAQNIRRCLGSVLANVGAEFEVLVLDDHSSDQTAPIVEEIASRDNRVRLLKSAPLPRNWCGKQFACHQLSQHATAPYLCFIDADVTLAPDALSRAIACLELSRADLVSGVPRQLTVTLVERLFVPLIHFILLAYLPVVLMRRHRHPAFAAGCGQFFVARREAYERMGGHRSIAQSCHDGIQLPHAFRSAGFRTDLFDLTDLASCRMYPNAGAVWVGLTKNATEGIGHPARIMPFTALILFGQVLPPLLLAASLISAAPQPITISFGLATAFSYAARFASASRFGQSWLGALLHPVALLIFLATQWWALLEEKRGRPVYWKGRKQPRAAI